MTAFDFPLAQTDIGDAERDAVMSVLDRGWISSGPEIGAFEEAFAAFCDARHAVMVNSGTSALTVGFLALGIGPGDEVILPSLTFSATLNGVLATGACAVLVDVDEQGLICFESVQAALSPATAAVVPVDLYGQCVDLPRLRQCIGSEIAIVEDAAEALGAEAETFAASGVYQAGHISGHGEASIFGFYPNKVLTTGEGGMLVTNDSQVAARVRARINQSRRNDSDADVTLEIGELPGFSMRGNELAAAMGRVQLTTLGQRLLQRRALAGDYLLRLAAVLPAGQRPFINNVNATSWFTMPILWSDKLERDHLWQALKYRGVASARYFAALHREPAVLALPRDKIRTLDCSRSAHIADHILCLPFWPGLGDQLPELMDRLSHAIHALGSAPEESA